MMETFKTESNMKRVRKQLLATYEFTTNGKFEVRVYENRVEVEHKGTMNIFTKGLTGTVIFYLKHLCAVEKSLGYIQFVTSGFRYVDSTTKKVQSDNTVTFSNKEYDKAQELIDIINELIN